MKILCVHQGYELYGSDRMFVLSIIAINKTYQNAKITIHLPCKGLLSDYIETLGLNTEIVFNKMAVLRKSDFKKLRFGPIFKSFFLLKKKIIYCNQFNLIYINSIVVFDYLLALHYSKTKSIIHIHEIPSKKLTSVFVKIIHFSKAYPFYISKAVKNNFQSLKKGIVINNGIKGFDYLERNLNHKLKILHIGRINSWKGQDFLLKSLSESKDHRLFNYELRIVGNVFERQHNYLDKLYEIVEEKRLNNNVKFYDFDSNPIKHFHWADVVVVPSKSPEPFGLVAIEAISSGAVVIAAKHGGLGEIFTHRISGLYFAPNNTQSLLEELTYISKNPDLYKTISKNGYELFKKNYTESSYINRFQIALKNII